MSSYSPHDHMILRVWTWWRGLGWAAAVAAVGGEGGDAEAMEERAVQGISVVPRASSGTTEQRYA